MKQYRIQYEKEITGIVKDEIIVYAESPEQAREKFEEQDLEADTIKIDLVHNTDPNQLEFPFMATSPFEQPA